MRKFFVDINSISDNEIFITDAKDVRHIVRVLRLKQGDKIVISTSDEWEYMCEISSLDLDKVVGKIIDKQKNSTESNLKVTLFQGIPKAGKMDDTVRKVTELGISEVYPIFMSRTVVADKGNFSNKIKRLKKISQEASKQCKRGQIPEIHDSLDFSEMIERLEEFDLNIFLYEGEKNTTLKQVLKDVKEEVKTVSMIIGPEGGFSDDEAEILKTKGKSASLGKTVLRTETAGVVALSMLMYALEMDG